MAMNNDDRRVLQVTCYGHFLSHFNMLVFPAVVLPLKDHWQISMSEVLETSFWMYLLFGITALPWGLAADRWGAKRLMMLYYAGAGTGGLISAFFLDSPLFFSISLALIGLFSGIYHPAGLGLISKTTRRMSYAMGINGMFGNLGLASAPLIAGLVNWIWGPQTLYMLLGLLNLSGVIVMMIHPLPAAKQQEDKTKAPAANSLSPFLILLVAMMLGGIAYRGATVVLPAYLELKNQTIYQSLSSIGGTALSQNLLATLATSFIFLVGMVGQYIGGRIAEKTDARFSYLWFHVITVPLAFVLAVTGDMMLILVAVAYFFFLLGMQPIENTLVAQLTPRHLQHSAFGTKFVLTFGVGALAVKMAAIIERQISIEAVYPAMGLVSLLLVFTILLLIRQTRTEVRDSQQ